MTTPYRHTIRVRYGEVDKQGVVFNAHYMAYMDDAMETWLHEDGDSGRGPRLDGTGDGPGRGARLSPGARPDAEFDPGPESGGACS